MTRTYVLDTGVLLNLLRGGELGRQIDHAFGLQAAMYRHTVSIVTHAELKVLALRNEWGEKKVAALKRALDEVVTVNVDSQELVDAYVQVESASSNVPNGVKNLGKNDIWIAATALVSGLPLITTDKDFDHLNGPVITVHWVDPSIGSAGSA